MKLLLNLSFLFISFIGISQSASTLLKGTNNEIMIQLEGNASPHVLFASLDELKPGGISYLGKISRRWNIHLFRFDPLRWEEKTLIDWFKKQSSVKAVQSNHEIDLRTEPNDPEYFYQWSPTQIGAPAAWSISTDGLTALGDTIVVAVMDNFFDLNHEDIQANFWNNAHEIPEDGIDNDNNGYIDDTWGWNFIEKNNNSDDNADDHGLAVSGIIGAKGNNNIGMTGLNWNIKIISLYVLRPAQVVEACEYIIDLRQKYNESNGAEGAFVVAANSSFGKDFVFCDEEPIWGGMYDEMGKVGILSGAATTNRNINVEIEGDMPTSCESDFMLTVLNSTADNEKAITTGYGKVSVDMAAPGEEVYSLRRFNRYGEFGGTSAAAPHLTSAISLLYSVPCEKFAANALSKPMETALIVRQAILDGVEPIEAFENITATGGRLNIANAFQQIDIDCENTTSELDIVSIIPNPASDALNITFEVPEIVSYQFNIFNSIGQSVYKNEKTPPRFGKKTHTIDVSNWAEGTYFLTLQMGEHFTVEPIAIIRYR